MISRSESIWIVSHAQITCQAVSKRASPNHFSNGSGDVRHRTRSPRLHGPGLGRADLADGGRRPGRRELLLSPDRRLVQESKRSKSLSLPPPPTQSIPASFRDPAGSLLHYQGRILRIVNALGAADLEAFLASPSGRKLMASGAVVPTRALDAAECRELLADPSVRQLYDALGGQIVLGAARVDFPSFS